MCTLVQADRDYALGSRFRHLRFTGLPLSPSHFFDADISYQGTAHLLRPQACRSLVSSPFPRNSDERYLVSGTSPCRLNKSCVKVSYCRNRKSVGSFRQPDTHAKAQTEFSTRACPDPCISCIQDGAWCARAVAVLAFGLGTDDLLPRVSTPCSHPGTPGKWN